MLKNIRLFLSKGDKFMIKWKNNKQISQRLKEVLVWILRRWEDKVKPFLNNNFSSNHQNKILKQQEKNIKRNKGQDHLKKIMTKKRFKIQAFIVILWVVLTNPKM
jgi:hypothetical protein